MMSMVTTAELPGLPRGRELTRCDLEAMPDDGHRYELLDGTLLVTPGPRPVHQRVSGRIQEHLRHACPPGLEALAAPLDVVLDDRTVLQPDVLVTRTEDLSERNLPTVPVLALEILSPSTRDVDLHLKKARLARAGCPHYWVIDPDLVAITAWDLVDGKYVVSAHARGEELFRVERPFPVAIVPSSLVNPPID
jgi:Uma2 family endonuclease